MPKGMIDQLINAAIARFLESATDPAKLTAALTAADLGLQPETVRDLAGVASIKLRAFLEPLVQ